MRVRYLTVKHICHVAVVVVCCVNVLRDNIANKTTSAQRQTTVEAVADWRRFNLILFICLFIDCSSSLGFISHGGTEKIYQNNNFPPAENQQDPPSKTITLKVPSSSLLALVVANLRYLYPPSLLSFPVAFWPLVVLLVTSGNQWTRGAST